MQTGDCNRLLLLLCLLPTLLAAAGSFDLSLTDKHGAILNSADCNPQTTVDFVFSSESTAASATTVV